MEKLSQVLLLLLIGLIGYGLGRKIFKLLKLRFHCLSEEIISSIALGWGALAYLVLALGLLGLLYRGVAYGLLGLLALISIPEIKTLVVSLSNNLARLVKKKSLNRSTQDTPSPSRPLASTASPYPLPSACALWGRERSPKATCRGEIKERGLKKGFLYNQVTNRAATDESISRAFKVSLFFLLGATFAVALIGALTPPLNYDALSYHLGVPKLYIRSHRIIYLPHQVYSNFPFTIEMLYSLSLLLKGDILAKLIHLSFGLLTTGAIYSLSRRYFSQKIALLAAAIFYNIPLIGFLSTTAYIDLGVTLFQLLALIGLVNWFYSKRRDDFISSALFCGLAMGTKYPAILFSFLPLLLGIVVKMILTDEVRRTGNIRRALIQMLRLAVPLLAISRWPGTLKRVFIFSLVAIGIASPWFIKNFIYTANPIYPLFYNLFGGKDWSALNALRFMKHHSAPFSYWWEIFRLPLDISKSKDMGALFIIFTPLIIFFKRFEKQAKVLLVYGGLYLLLWMFFTHRDYRFLLPALPVFSLVAAYLMIRFRKRNIHSLLLLVGLGAAVVLNYERIRLFGLYLIAFQEGILLVPLSLGLSALIVFLGLRCLKTKSLSPLVVAGVGLVMLINLLSVAVMIPGHDLLRAALGRESREEFLSRTFYAYDAFRFCNERLPQSAKILFIGENQGYYCDRDFLANSPLDDNIIVRIVNSSNSEVEIRESLKEMGITHILYNASEVKRVDRDYSSFNWADEEAKAGFFHFLFSGEFLRPVFSRSGVLIYELQ